MAMPDVKTYFEVVEHNKSRDFELLARKYRAIVPLLTKMEGLVVATNTGRADKMANYYRHWERQVHDAIYQAITMNSSTSNASVHAVQSFNFASNAYNRNIESRQ